MGGGASERQLQLKTLHNNLPEHFSLAGKLNGRTKRLEFCHDIVPSSFCHAQQQNTVGKDNAQDFACLEILIQERMMQHWDRHLHKSRVETQMPEGFPEGYG